MWIKLFHIQSLSSTAATSLHGTQCLSKNRKVNRLSTRTRNAHLVAYSDSDDSSSSCSSSDGEDDTGHPAPSPITPFYGKRGHVSWFLYKHLIYLGQLFCYQFIYSPHRCNCQRFIPRFRASGIHLTPCYRMSGSLRLINDLPIVRLTLADIIFLIWKVRKIASNFCLEAGWNSK